MKGREEECEEGGANAPEEVRGGTEKKEAGSEWGEALRRVLKGEEAMGTRQSLTMPSSAPDATHRLS